MLMWNVCGTVGVGCDVQETCGDQQRDGGAVGVDASSVATDAVQQTAAATEVNLYPLLIFTYCVHL